MQLEDAGQNGRRGEGKVRVKVSSVQLNEATGNDFDFLSSLLLSDLFICVLLTLTVWSFFILHSASARELVDVL